MDRSTPAFVLVVVLIGCKQGPGEPAPKGTGSGANPDWPCSNHISTSTATAPSFRYEYTGPSACTTTPDLVLTGCPTVEQLDENGDGTSERWRTFRYDAGGRLVAVEYRRAPTGPVFTKLALRYTADGAPERSDVDEGADGTIEVYNLYERKDGALIRRLHRDGDGVPDLIATSRFDNLGRVLETSIEQGGRVAATASYRWDGGRLVDETTRMDDMEFVTTYAYDCKR